MVDLPFLPSKVSEMATSRVNVLRYITEFRFFEVLRGHLSKLIKSVLKNCAGIGRTPPAFAVYTLFTMKPREMLRKIDKKLPVLRISTLSICR